MSAWEYGRRIAAMTERDSQIWTLASRAVNELGVACELAAQGAENSQCKREAKSDAAMHELFELLAPALTAVQP